MRSDEVNTVLDQKDQIDVQDFKLKGNTKNSRNAAQSQTVTQDENAGGTQIAQVRVGPAISAEQINDTIREANMIL